MGYFLYSFGSNPDEIWEFYHATTVGCWFTKGMHAWLGCLLPLFFTWILLWQSCFISTYHPTFMISAGLLWPSCLDSEAHFTLGVKAETNKIFSICPKLLFNVELYGLVLTPRLKKDTNEFGKPICNPWGQTISQICSKLAPSFSGPDS